MARKPGPTWEQLTEDQKMRFDKLFTLILKVKRRMREAEVK